MKLDRIQISNFLSIPDNFEIRMDPSCRVLVGINEAGKSNILRALSMLCKDVNPSPSDKREPLPGEDQYKESSVCFIFKLDRKELERITSTFKEFVLCSNLDKPLFQLKDRKISFKEIILEKDEVIYEADLSDQSKRFKYWSLSNLYTVLPNWKKPTENAPVKHKLKNGKEIQLKEIFLINIDEYKEISKDFLEDATPEYINKTIGSELVAHLKSNLPDCIFWKYEEKNILPSKVDLAKYSANPDICLPLKYMFQLAKYDDIQKAFQEAKQRNVNHGINNLLDRVATEATKYFQSVWKDYKSIEFYLKENGANIDVAIKDTKNLYDFEERSDGFKRFVTFLLMISVRVKKELMKNTLILIDEPSIGLHPSAEKYLREELISISKRNYVVYSTHSIFMIDKDNISRHIIVKKENEKTFSIDAKESNIFDEEVLYKALGSSVFEIIKRKNILFEGWRDKKLFQTALRRVPSDHSKLKKAFKDVGLAHSKGVKFMKFITPVFESANKDCYILSDTDEPAKRYQKEFEEEKLYGDWKRYDEILSGAQEITAEDFIRKVIFVKLCKKVMKDNSILTELTESDFEDSRGIMFVLKEWLKASTINSEMQKEVLDSIKENVFAELKPSQIGNNYYNLIEKLAEHMDLFSS